MPVSAPECARFIVSPHVVEFIISRVKSINIIQYNWISKNGYVAWENKKETYKEQKEKNIYI